MRRLISGYSITAVVFLVAAVLTATPARAVDYTWTGGDTTDPLEWTAAANWGATDYPDASTDTATFDTAVTANTTITQGADITLNRLTYSATSTGGYLTIGDSSHRIAFAGDDPTLQANSQLSGWAGFRIASKIDVGTGGLTVTASGSPRRGTRAVSGILGSGDITITQGTLELQGNSSTYTGTFIVQNAAELQVIGNAATAMGDTDHHTELHGNGYVQFRGVTGTCSEPIDVYGIRASSGTIDQFATNGVTLDGAITLYSDTSFGIHSWATNGIGAKQDFTVNSVIADGDAGDYSVYFLGDMNGSSEQGTESRKSEFVLGGNSTYGGDTYVTANQADDATTGEFSGNLRITVDDALPTSTTLILGGVHSTDDGNLGVEATNGKFVLGGNSQELAGLVTSGTGTRNMVVGASSDLSTLTLNIASGTNAYDGYLGYADEVDDGDSSTYEETNRNNLALVKTGAGTLELTAANTYTGTTTVSAGTLVLGDPSSLGSATSAVELGDADTGSNDVALLLNDVDSGPFTFSRAVQVNNAGSGTVTVGSNTAGSGSGYYVQFTNTITLDNKDLHIQAVNVDRTTFTGRITGTGDLYVDGPNRATFSNTGNDFVGDVYITAGTMQLQGGSAIPDASSVTVSSGAYLRIWDASETIDALNGSGGVRIGNSANTLTVGAAGGSGSFSGVLYEASGGTLALLKTGAGTQTLSGNNTYSGTTQIDEGVLRIASDTALGSTSAGTTIASGARLELSGGITVAGESVTVNGNGGTDYLGALRSISGANVWAGGVTLGSGARIGASGASTLEISGAITGSALEIRTTNDSAVILSSDSNDYGSTRVVLGVLKIAGGDDRLPTDQILRMGHGGTGGPATFDLNGFNQEVSGLSSEGAVVTTFVTNASATLATLTVNGSADYSYGGTGDAGLITGNLALVKNGSGTMTLTSGNTYSGGTTVLGGTLMVNNTTGSGTGTGAVLVDGGTLGGTGTIAGAVTVDSGSLAPGASPGILTLEDGLTFAGGSFSVEINGTIAGDDYDQLLVTGGDVDLGLGVATLDVAGSFSASPDDFIWIINNTSGSTDGYFQDLVEEGSSLIMAGRRFYVYYHGDVDTNQLFGGNDVVLTSVPEPSTLAMLLGLAGIGLLVYRRRRAN